MLISLKIDKLTDEETGRQAGRQGDSLIALPCYLAEAQYLLLFYHSVDCTQLH